MNKKEQAGNTVCSEDFCECFFVSVLKYFNIIYKAKIEGSVPLNFWPCNLSYLNDQVKIGRKRN